MGGCRAGERAGNMVDPGYRHVIGQHQRGIVGEIVDRAVAFNRQSSAAGDGQGAVEDCRGSRLNRIRPAKLQRSTNCRDERTRVRSVTAQHDQSGLGIDDSIVRQ